MTSVSEAETAALVLRYLEGNTFTKAANSFKRCHDCMLSCPALCLSSCRFCTAHTCTTDATCLNIPACREAKKLLASIVAPATVKSLNAILNEFVLLKEQEVKRKQLAKAHIFISDLLAVIDSHTGPQASQSEQPKDAAPPKKPSIDISHVHDLQAVPIAAELPEFSAVQASIDLQDELCAAATLPDDVSIQHQQQQQQQQQQGLDQQQATATPAQTSAGHGMAAGLLASRHPASSQHRKGAPKRRIAQPETWPSPVNASSTLPSSEAVSATQYLCAHTLNS